MTEAQAQGDKDFNLCGFLTLDGAFANESDFYIIVFSMLIGWSPRKTMISHFFPRGEPPWAVQTGIIYLQLDLHCLYVSPYMCMYTRSELCTLCVCISIYVCDVYMLLMRGYALMCLMYMFTSVTTEVPMLFDPLVEH